MQIKLFLSAFFLLMSFDFGKSATIKQNGTDAANVKEEACKCPKKNEKPMDCDELRENGNAESGVYTIWPRNRNLECSSIEVYCDMDTTGGGWTVIQRRGQFGNGIDYFVKKWNEYKAGFGNLKEEFWLGNDNIYSLTNQGKYSLRLDMTHENGTGAFAVYENFWIDNEEDQYKLRISEYSGTAGDSISNHNGSLFYTVDRANQPSWSKPEWNRSGGWWLNHISTTSLNGLNLFGKEPSENGTNWFYFGGLKSSLKATEMKIRLRNFSG